MIPKIKLFLNSDTINGVFGDGKYQLLLAIKKHGSIQQAALSLERSYRKAWGDIKLAEMGFGRKIVQTNRGGISRGESTLTEFGLQLLEKWKDYSSELNASVAIFYKKHLEWTEQPADQDKQVQKKESHDLK